MVGESQNNETDKEPFQLPRQADLAIKKSIARPFFPHCTHQLSIICSVILGRVTPFVAHGLEGYNSFQECTVGEDSLNSILTMVSKVITFDSVLLQLLLR